MRPGETADLAVLVVDDDFMVASIRAELVEEVEGFRVAGTAVNGQQALDMVSSLTPDLLLLDVHLPDMSGIDVLRRLRERGDDVDAIVVTAERDAEFVKAALRGGAAQYLIKPFDLDELRARIVRYARVRLGSGKADQLAVDAAFSVTRSAAPAPHRRRRPQGSEQRESDLVRAALADGDELSASTCAEATGMARPTVRRYLEYLVERREAKVRLKYGGGRPGNSTSCRVDAGSGPGMLTRNIAGQFFPTSRNSSPAMWAVPLNTWATDLSPKCHSSKVSTIRVMAPVAGSMRATSSVGHRLAHT